MVEICFGIITRQAIRRDTFTSVKNLITAVEVCIDGWNQRCPPFTWVKTADEIAGKINRKRTNATRHQGLLYPVPPGPATTGEVVRAPC